ncbi:MAG: hypothetical protein BAJATHORv1_20067 [Candidatus Thorarchaeota archaeon]|nr:MAG: hypothetical protein BAJATHORv1_20067 [Candidatus Thorarchaeota archaeon]
MTEEAAWDSESGTFLRVVVKPKSRERELIADIEQSWVVINLKSAARGGKANTELVKRVSKLFGLSTSEVLLVKGQRSREKIIQIYGLTAKEVMITLKASHKQ